MLKEEIDMETPQIKLGDIFEVEIDGECNGNWTIEYKVIKITRNFITVTNDRGHKCARKVHFSDTTPGYASIAISPFKIATLKTN